MPDQDFTKPNIFPPEEAKPLEKPVFKAETKPIEPTTESPVEDITADYPQPPSTPSVPPRVVPPVSSAPPPAPVPLPETPPAPGSPIMPAEQEISPQPKSSFPGKLKWLLFLSVLLALFFAFYKFVFPMLRKSTSGGEVILTYWGLWEPEEVMKGVISEWEKDHPNIKVNYVMQSSKEYRERLQSSLAREEGPDIFRFHISWVPMFRNELEMVPASVMSSAQYESSFYPVVVNNLRFQNSYLGLPLMMDTFALYYNQDLFEKAGKNPPKTWEELRQTATDMTTKDEDGRLVVAGVSLGTTSNVDHWSDILGLMFLQNGADFASPAVCTKKTEGEGEKEICLGADALTFYTIFNKVDRVWDETMPPSTVAFASNKTAMYFAPSWRVFEIKQLNPDLRFAITSVPQLTGSEVNWASFWVEGVSKRSQNKEAAWEFLKFLSSPEILEKLYQTASNQRLFGEPYPRVDMASKLINNPIVEPFISQAAKAQTWYLCSNTGDNGINDRMIKYYEDAVNSVNLGKSSKEALQTAAQGVSQLLSQYNISSPIVR